ncbi:hypothetical protein HYC85_017837 [Camellia sinensis]|uniref:Uncharacterized protein n=1 Tax=Camellia sinensis TaxID=4442 RepID=A0A7J7GST6_CAMSI|nr:hypothetical protein HYC85_017837 [Camellia sinensis]
MNSCAPLLFRKKSHGFEGKESPVATIKRSNILRNLKLFKGSKVHNSNSATSVFLKMEELRKKILTFRDLIDLPPCVGSASANELVITTVKDLHVLYPNIVPKNSMSEIEGTPINQALASLCQALKSIGDMWMSKDEWVEKSKTVAYDKMTSNKLEQHALAMLHDMIKLARERLFDLMDEDEPVKVNSPKTGSFGRSLSESSYSENKSPFGSPATPTSVLPVMTTRSAAPYCSPLLLPLRVQAVEKLNPIDFKRLSFHMFHYMAGSGHRNTTVGEQKQEKEVNNDCEITETSGIELEDTEDCKIKEDIQKILMINLEKITSDKGRNWIGNPNISLGPSPRSLKFRPNVAEAGVLPPPPPSTPTSPMVEVEVEVEAEVDVLPPPPPSTPMSPMAEESTLPPPPPPPPMSQNVVASPPSSPPPPPPPEPPMFITLDSASTATPTTITNQTGTKCTTSNAISNAITTSSTATIHDIKALSNATTTAATTYDGKQQRNTSATSSWDVIKTISSITTTTTHGTGKGSSSPTTSYFWWFKIPTSQKSNN